MKFKIGDYLKINTPQAIHLHGQIGVLNNILLKSDQTFIYEVSVKKFGQYLWFSKKEVIRYCPIKCPEYLS